MQTIVGIFAHPDDEAFGPSGTIAKMAKENDIYLICATNGDAASGKHDPQLGEIRKEELKKSAKILGVKEVFFLEFKDGTLCNNIYPDLAKSIKSIVEKIKPYLVITLEPRGVSGHIDHITISMVTSFVCQKLSYVKEIWYNCISDKTRSMIPSYFIYFPPGYRKEEIDLVINVKDYWRLKRSAILQHKSQIKDALSMLAIEAFSAKEEYFLVWKKQK